MSEDRVIYRNGGCSCLGCLLTIIAIMVLCSGLHWACNPGTSVEDAARHGILLGCDGNGSNE
jgi:hypothetical protein